MNHFNPQVITGIAGSHCIILLYGWDVHIDAQIESPGFTCLKSTVCGYQFTIKNVPDEEAPGQIVQMIREYARDAKI